MQSVMEWLVANHAAERFAPRAPVRACSRDGVSTLMADFFVDLAGHDVARGWAAGALAGAGAEGEQRRAKTNALLVLDRMKDSSVHITQLAGESLRGKDLSGRNMTGARLMKADLAESRFEDTTLAGADLSDAILVNADLTRANLTKATLGPRDAHRGAAARRDAHRRDVPRCDVTAREARRVRRCARSQVGRHLRRGAA